jgi:pimeloyl-ACP methyl ester carboxylesterase
VLGKRRRCAVTRDRVIAYDLRGRGDSDKPDTGYGLEAHGDDLAHLLDHYGLDRAVVVGHSLGAMIALTFAVKRHDRVSRLVLEVKSALRAFLAGG